MPLPRATRLVPDSSDATPAFRETTIASAVTGFPKASIALTITGICRPSVAKRSSRGIRVTRLTAPAPTIAVKATGAPAAVAVADCAPVVPPSVQLVLATPDASVRVFAAERLPPPEATAQATCTPETGLPCLSVTRTASESATAVPAAPARVAAPTTAVLAGASGFAVARKVANTSGAPVAASTARTSTRWLSAAAVEVPSVQRSRASPSSLVSAVPANTLPPPETTRKLTIWPCTGRPRASVTFATSALGSSVPATASCSSPLTMSNRAATWGRGPLDESHAASTASTAAADATARESFRCKGESPEGGG